MDPMPTQPAHAKPARRDLLWVLILIAACGLLEVWASWLQIGAVSGFPRLGAMTTGWILPVTTEAYWTAALYAWLVDPAGPKSKLFAMASGAGVFALSLAGQESDHLLAEAHRTAPPVWVVGFVTALPLIAVALVAVLMHLRQIDRAAAAETAREAAEVSEMARLAAETAAWKAAWSQVVAGAEGDREAARAEAESAAAAERTALRAELDAFTEALESTRAERDAAQRKAAVLTRKLAAAAPRKRTPQQAAKRPASAPRSAPAEDPATEVPNDVDAQAEALSILAAEPGISGAKLAERVGMSERWGQTFKKNLSRSAAGSGDDNQETP